MMNIMVNRTLRYGSAVVFIIAAFFIRQALVSLFGAELPHWITFYPVIMCVALMAGLGPGILATFTAVLLMDYFVFPPVGLFSIASPAQRLSLTVFTGMGLFMSVVAERYRRTHDRLEELVEERTGELSRANKELKAEVEERKRAEEELRDSESLLRITLENILDPVFITDDEGRFTFICANVYSILGYTVEEIGAMGNISKLLGEGLFQLDDLKSRREIRNIDCVIARKDGCLNDYLLTVKRVSIKGGTILYVCRDITDRKLADETLREAYDEMTRLVEAQTMDLKEKEVLLREIHHRVKNNMQVISSLVGLQADNSTDETVRSVLADVTDRVHSMALVHEKLYQSANFASIDFAEYANALLCYLWHVHSSEAAAVHLTLDMKPVSLPMDKAVPCGLILNELAGNTLKHAFRGRDKGEVTISIFGDSEERIHLCVKDDGVGLPEGFDWLQTQTLGLNLVQLLSRQLAADVEVSGSNGTRFEISFARSKD